MRLPVNASSTLIAGLALAISDPAWSAGFAVKNQSSLAQGNAFAGATAGADDISYMFFNPAGLTRHSGHQAEIGASYVAPTVRFKDGEASTILSSTITGADEQDDVGENAVVPSAYVMTSLSKTWRAAIGLNWPFGQTTSYQDGWVGRYHALNSELKAVNINPTLAWRIRPSLSIGAGMQIQYFDAELSNAIDFGTIGAAAGVPGAVPGAQDGEAKVEGDDWALGYNFGILWTPTRTTRIGMAYRSRIEHELRGEARFTTDEAGVGDALAAGTGRFTNTGARTETTLPATLSAGFHQDITRHWAVMGEVAWTSWSDVEELRIVFDNPNEEDNVTDLNFKDSIFAALGITWRPNDRWSVRGGLAYDQGATRTRFRTPRLSGGDRYWLAAGVSYAPKSWLDFSFGMTRIFVEDTDIELTTAGTGNQFRGNLSGTFDADITTASLSARVRF